MITAYLLTSTAVTPLWGKLSDLYGRRGTFQAAIAIFLAGSMLSGLSQNMGELIAFQAVQGLGGGGLMALAMAIVGDLVSPRERGRYQGYFGAVFALASVSGPLLGGYLTDQLSWRWIFYVNLPLGIATLLVTTVVLRIPFRRLRRRIDYPGSLLLVAAVSCVVTTTTWVGLALFALLLREAPLRTTAHVDGGYATPNPPSRTCWARSSWRPPSTWSPDCCDSGRRR